MLHLFYTAFDVNKDKFTNGTHYTRCHIRRSVFSSTNVIQFQQCHFHVDTIIAANCLFIQCTFLKPIKLSKIAHCIDCKATSVDGIDMTIEKSKFEKVNTQKLELIRYNNINFDISCISLTLTQCNLHDYRNLNYDNLIARDSTFIECILKNATLIKCSIEKTIVNSVRAYDCKIKDATLRGGSVSSSMCVGACNATRVLFEHCVMNGLSFCNSSVIVSECTYTRLYKNESSVTVFHLPVIPYDPFYYVYFPLIMFFASVFIVLHRHFLSNKECRKSRS